ncbi:MAG: ATP-dependent metallopeptidase FtsH/Yme1/Tma family protein, partial [Spirochaetia bacterium]|nr:ATP-dependent metallopeptidase FtsH/Yme1/Tma family protein [Spirochaetia bacterium]
MKPFEKRSGKPEIEVKKPENPPPGRSSYVTMIIYFTLLVSLVFLWRYSVNKASTEISYSTFLELMEEGKIENAEISENLIEGTLKEKDPETQKQKEFRTIPPKNQELAALLKKHGISYSVRIESTWFYTLLSWIIPFGLIILFWLWISSKMTQTGGGAGSFLNIGNRVHIHAETLPTVTFKDVADSEEVKEELKESIDFLKDPSRIQRLGGRMPKGILLLGAPGTGKTLLARAVSGEAGVPFFNISGSEFIEMFVGVGAARVRDLFHQARDKAPCIIFIDELDAIGRTRGGPVTMGGHDEREQTLNQLLTEMDGFDPSTGVVVMAATNRPEILDRALLRAGRFDRQIIVDKPDLKAREAILKLHSKKLIISEDVDLTIVAQRTPGFVGADLANISNEAAIIAVRHDHKFVTMQDFEEAIDRIIAGPEKKHRVLNKEEKRRVAFHESGHAVTAMNVDTGDTVHKVSI